MRPASTPIRMAAAIIAGSAARAMAVLIRQQSAPSSIAAAASDGTPMPASTTTGTVACSMMILHLLARLQALAAADGRGQRHDGVGPDLLQAPRQRRGRR